MNLLSSKIFNLLFITISCICIIFLPSCDLDSVDEAIEAKNEKFRSKYDGTYWETDDLVIKVIKFSEDKLFSFTDGGGSDGGGSECYYYEEGSINDVDYDGCRYDKVTMVLIEELNDKLVFREIVNSGTATIPGAGFCDGSEVTVTFQELGENAISMIVDYGGDFGSETFTLIRSNPIAFSSNSCSNALSSGYLF
mgnify:CR=1 FL=1